MSVPERRDSLERRALTETLEHAARDTKAFVMRQTPLVRWTGAGIILVLLVWAFTSGEPDATATSTPVVGEPVAGDSLPPITREQALAHIAQTRSSALVEVHSDEVYVSFPAANFPLDEAGQVLLVRRFVQADAMVEGRTRRIFFHNPTGRMFAQSDAATGVSLIR